MPENTSPWIFDIERVRLVSDMHIFKKKIVRWSDILGNLENWECDICHNCYTMKTPNMCELCANVICNDCSTNGVLSDSGKRCLNC